MAHSPMPSLVRGGLKSERGLWLLLACLFTLVGAVNVTVALSESAWWQAAVAALLLLAAAACARAARRAAR
ncbi:hypothetical protein [Saccharothrix coeruleofusca]|uniref:Uncharacterized protein n=1 Tax=Saccharothrix coeruleofusca TaxID=33919 RepID=A0A918APE9_9PSEU|nr:hypothetical protein [Saccharothrix coeruleofusca]GGP64631.1 hypothetical protein GCM10010185_41420 [Saccharothrix coeruleofusca]